ncbi:MAG: kynureninase, partial [Acidobacteriota bacterium]
DRSGTLTLAANTHDLLIRFLSALPLGDRPRLVTTDGEFHTIRRQLERLEEEGLDVVRISSEDPLSLSERLAGAVDDRTAAVLVSTVLFGSGRIVPGLERALGAAQRHGAELLLDTYHQLAAVPFAIDESGLGAAFAVGGGYKYCQLGEGNCFLRVPPDRDLRPVVTGWFAEFEDLHEAPPGGVAYGAGAAAFAGATYDPTSHYRGAAVFDFFDAHSLDGQFLRQVSQHQVGRLAARFDALDLPPSTVSRPTVPLEELGAFLTLYSPRASELSDGLRERGVSTDVRGDQLRFGPAPYLCDRQLDDAVAALGEVVRGIEDR